MKPSTPAHKDPGPPIRRRWRTVDIVVAAVVGVAVGVVFWLWGLVWQATEVLFVFFPPAQAVLYGVWMLPGVLGALIIRKPGAALLTSITAASVSAFLGTTWGLTVVLEGALQGLLPELVFAAFLYRRWNVGVSVLAAMAAGLSPAVLDNVRYYPTWPLEYQLAYGGLVLISAALIAGVGARLLTTALARAGALAPFPSARG
ncbi:ECF transporter S component [Marinactinospora thermotolerans]|uniref:Energy-coupling factor transport system substrate-specific component n=1 Tax=Marinactinospora thermotolerans DSM 45154 TaxID=1122192 RepID=A0A1T4SEI1_9ACTN|nr:ECF transporter S component [Marinactinospora thermotolerans]SKA26546.1 energy-coupling factor transport system substrate-specific component [Marinactinospora thermotolerans DSM 45154]